MPRVLSVLLVFFFLMPIAHTRGQVVLKQMTGSFRHFLTVSAGDSVLFGYDDADKINTSEWISSGGSNTVALDENIFSAVAFGDQTYLYYILGRNTWKTLNYRIHDRLTNESVETDSIRGIVDNIIGTFVNGKNLCLVTLDKTGTELSIIAVNKKTIVHEKRYKLPQRINDYVSDETPVEFYIQNSPYNMFKGLAKIKFYMRDKFYVTVDQPDHQRTLIFQLNDSDSNVAMEILPDEEKFDLSTLLFEDKIFRTSIGKKKIVLKVFDFASKRIIAKKVFASTDSLFYVHSRHGRKNTIHTKAKSSYMITEGPGSEGVVAVQHQDGKYIIEVGTYYDKSPAIIVPIGPYAIITAIVGNLVSQLLDKPGVNRYFFCQWNGNGEIERRQQSNQLLREKIDQYEIELKKQDINYKYKSVIAHKNGVVCTFYDPKAQLASLLYFE